MMSLPFFLFACAIGTAWARQRSIAIVFWLVGFIAMLIVFQMHSTDILNISL